MNYVPLDESRGFNLSRNTHCVAKLLVPFRDMRLIDDDKIFI